MLCNLRIEINNFPIAISSEFQCKATIYKQTGHSETDMSLDGKTLQVSCVSATT